MAERLVTDQEPMTEGAPLQEPGLPPGAERLPNGQVVRRLEKPVSGGGSREVIRPVASTLAEAREKHWDFYHPVVGWVREGYKLEKDREPQDIMADGSSAVPDPSLVQSSQ